MIEAPQFFFDILDNKSLEKSANPFSRPESPCLGGHDDTAPDLKSTPSSRSYSVNFVFMEPRNISATFAIYSTIMRSTGSTQQLEVPQRPYVQGILSKGDDVPWLFEVLVI